MQNQVLVYYFKFELNPFYCLNVYEFKSIFCLGIRIESS